MKLEGFLLFVAMSIVVETITRIFTTLPYFTKNKDTDLVAYLKFLISLVVAETLSFSFVYLTKTGMILDYFGIITFHYWDAFLSGLMIGGGSNVMHDLFQTITAYKQKIQAQIGGDK